MLFGRLHRPHVVVTKDNLRISPIVLYSLIIFLVGLGDAVMSYIAPVIIESHRHNQLLMGIIIAFSSFIGFFCDFFFGELFHGKSYKFFFGMVVWGIYFELILFANFHFIRSFVSPQNHATSWGILDSFFSAAYFLVPIFIGYISDIRESYALFVALGFFLSGSLGYFVLLRALKPIHAEELVAEKQTKRSTFHELRIWLVLWKRVWPLYLFSFMTIIVDSTFWTVGALLSEELRIHHFYGSWLIPAYALPSLFVGFIAGKAARPFGKKKIALAAGVVCGIILAISGLLTNVAGLIFTVLLSSFFFALARPEISATFEDYIARIGRAGNDLIGLQNSAGSLAYVVGPIVAGAIATIVGNQKTFTVVGIALASVSLLAFLIIPRKIRMPEKELLSV